MSHFLLEATAGPLVALPEDEAHHAIRVLRLREGDTISGTDGVGTLLRGRLLFDPTPALEVDERLTVPRATPTLTVAFALTKGEKPEFVIEKLTELGVDRVIPWMSDRSIVRWDADKRRANGDRFRAVAVAAMKQSRRAWLPVVDDPVDLDCLLDGNEGLVVFDLDGAPLPPAPWTDPVTVIIGPEGGLTDAERASIEEAGAIVVGLSGGVLRAETAAIVAAALAADRMERWS